MADSGLYLRLALNSRFCEQLRVRVNFDSDSSISVHLLIVCVQVGNQPGHFGHVCLGEAKVSQSSVHSAEL